MSQLAGIALLHSQPIIITQLLGLGEVSVFHITHRILTLPLMVVQMFTFPLLAAYGEAYSRQDWPWIRRTLRRSLLASVATSVCSILPLVLLAKPIIGWWVGVDMVPDYTLVLSLGAYVIVYGIATPISVFLLGLEYVGSQAAISVASALVTIGLGVLLTVEFGLSGIAMAMAAGLAVALTIQVLQLWSVKTKMDRLDQERSARVGDPQV